MSDNTTGAETAACESTAITDEVERSFTCTTCGYAMTHQVGPLQIETLATCLNCGDWTVQMADVEDVIDAAREIADQLAGTVLTERQALAYLLRDAADLDRQTAAEAMDTTPSNVDNLQRRGREKVTDAHRVVEVLQALTPDSETDCE